MARIFSDGFESGDFSAWTAASASNGITLGVNSSAAIHGDYGALVSVQGTAGAGAHVHVYKTLPAALATLYFRFYFRVARLVYGYGELRLAEFDNGHYLLAEQAGASTFKLRFRYKKDGGVIFYTGYTSTFAVGEEVCIEVEWRAATAPGANDGVVRLWLNNVLEQEVTGIDNDTYTQGALRCPRVYELGTPKNLDLHFDSCVLDDAERVYPVGWFNVYHNSGLGPIDYGTVRGMTCDTKTSWTSGALSYPAAYRFGVRAQNRYGEEKNVNVVDEVVLLSSGQEDPMRPNRPVGLRAAPAADGKVEVVFSYDDTDEEAECTHFHIYHDAGSGEVNYSSPVGSVNRSEGPLTHYGFLSGALTNGQTYRFAVRAAAAGDVEDDGIEFVEVTVDAQAPTQPGSLSGRVVR